MVLWMPQVIAPQATVIASGAVIVGNGAGSTVIILDTDASALPQASVAVHVSVTGPPHDPVLHENVDGLDVPVIRHPPVSPLVKVLWMPQVIAPQATVMCTRCCHCWQCRRINRDYS